MGYMSVWSSEKAGVCVCVLFEEGERYEGRLRPMWLVLLDLALEN